MVKLQACVLLAAFLGVALANNYGSGRRAYVPRGTIRRPNTNTGSGGNIVGVYGTWGQWSGWSDCDKECGGGYKRRSRQCHKPLYSLLGNGNCQGNRNDRKACNTHYCVVNGGWSQWGVYGDCSKYCGGGVRTKRRTCTNPAPAYGGNNCYGSSIYTESCNTHHCQIHGGWAEWGTYSDCSVVCGTGYKTKYRTCTNPAPLYGGNDCYGDNSYTESCTGYHCPVHGGWSEWGHYSACSKDCGGGVATKYRTCTNPAPAYGGNDCYGSSSYTETCNSNYCPVHGGWAEWGTYSECSAKCGAGYKTKYRTCTYPTPAYGGNDCYGANSYTESCTGYHCPVDGAWSEWGTYSTCSKDCGGGYYTKYRTCTNPAPAYGGSDCYGSNSYTESCNTHYCKVHGGWAEWGTYSDCSVDCGTGYKTKYRTCTNPAPLYGGNDCYGDSSYTESCTGYHCAVHGGWSEWGTYSDCSVNCGTGYKTKYRTCNNPAPSYGGNDCYGANSHTVSCSGYQCQVDGGWSHWNSWSSCSGGCGNGQKRRTRSCTSPSPSYGGAGCAGYDYETKACYSSSGCYGYGGRRY